MYALYWDDAAEGEKAKLARAIYSSLAEAEAQRDHDIERGRRIVCIEKIEKVEREFLNRGEVVWEPS